MGRYLAIGIDYELIVSEKEAKKEFTTLEEAKQKILDEYDFQDIYNIKNKTTNDDNLIVFTLKSEIIEQELYPFIKDFFAWRYPNDTYYNTQDILAAIEHIKTYEQMLEYADKSHGGPLFRSDTYADRKTTLINQQYGRRLYFKRKDILLSYDGKIIMECYGEIFYRFMQLLKEKFIKYKLAKAIDVFITG